jgi:hypothetical protein
VNQKYTNLQHDDVILGDGSEEQGDERVENDEVDANVDVEGLACFGDICYPDGSNLYYYCTCMRDPYQLSLNIYRSEKVKLQSLNTETLLAPAESCKIQCHPLA